MPAGGGGRAVPSGGSRPQPASKPAARPTINGGAQRSPTRTTPAVNKGGTGGNLGAGQAKTNAGSGDRRSGNINVGSGDRTNIRGGDKVNIGSGNTTVNINVDNSHHVNNSHNTTVRRNNNIHYNNPPYSYGGYHYNYYNPYHYHPYQPYYWGPVWHPWGFVVATLATTAIIVSINNAQYHYDQGVYYVESGSGYTVVQAPVGATIKVLPDNTETVAVTETTNNYYYGGTYYEKVPEGFTVVPPTAGTVVENLPEGAEEVKIGDQTYVKFGETYYTPVKKDGKDMYEVVEVEEAA